MSSPLTDVNVYSSFLTVERVKLCPCPRLVLTDSEGHINRSSQFTNQCSLIKADQINQQISADQIDQWINACLPAAGAVGDLGEGALQQDVFLVIHDVHTSPVHRNDHLVLWQGGTRESVRLVEPREQERPLEFGIHHDLLLHTGAVSLVADIRSLREYNCSSDVLPH